MLGARTKQINVYGRRQQRIITISENSLPTSHSKTLSDELSVQLIPKPPTPVHRKKEHTPRTQPGAVSPARPSITKHTRVKQLAKVHKASIVQATAPEEPLDITNSASRVPLGTYDPNTPSTPAKPSRTRKHATHAKSSGLKKAFDAFIDVDITVLSSEGNVEKQEKRVTRANERSSRAAKTPKTMYGLETDEESNHQPKRPKIGQKKTLILLTDDEGEGGSLEPEPRPSKARPQVVCEVSLPSRAKSIRSAHRDTKPTSPPQNNHSSIQSHRLSSPPLPPRQLTPLRKYQRLYPKPADFSLFPSISLEIDDSLDLSDFELEGVDFPSPHIPIPQYLLPLLAECSQEDTGPHEFSAFIETFPFDPIAQTKNGTAQFRKVGEASYSEVFGIGEVVLKVIPLRNEEADTTSLRALADLPPPSDAGDVLKEMVATRAMGEICPGFVQLLRTYVVRGKYPELLLRLWDEYADNKGSESIRPDGFSLSQTYAIIALPNRGPDLEHFIFHPTSKFCWRQACSIFWQVTKSLSRAEDIVSFEHRDLHWGQVLIKQQEATSNNSSHVYLDDASHGVTVTIIDLGLSRMNGNSSEAVLWTEFEEEIFSGEGDYQFDVYRMMRNHFGPSSWEQFKPLTNVMWLHYLTLKLLKSKGLKAPTARKSTTSTKPSQSLQVEREAYECLVEVENLLRKSVAPYKGGASRKSGVRKAGHTPASASDVVKYGVERSWVLM